MAISSGGRGMGYGMGLGNQQRALEYLSEGKPNIRKTLRLVWQSLRPYRFQFVLGTFVMFFGIGLSLIPPLLVKEIIDIAIPQHDFSLTLLLGAGLLLFPAGSALLGWAQNYLSVIITQGLIADLRLRLYLHVQSLGLEFFIKTRAGSIITRFLNDAGGLQNVINQSFLGTIANLIAVIGAFIIMITINWQLALISAIALPTFAFPILYFGKQRYEASERAQAALGELAVILEETLSLSGAIVVKSFGTEDREANRFKTINDLVKKEQTAQTLVGQWLGVIVQTLAALGPALLYTYGAYLVISHQAALGTIIAFATYLAQLYGPATSLVGANATLVGGLALFDRVFSYLEIPVTVAQSKNPKPLPGAPTEGISFHHVNFRYPGKSDAADVLHNITFTASRGELTALVGPSGAGKSTILSLAARFYDPTSGNITIDGIPLTDISKHDLRHQLSVVTQELFLFHTTLKENIRYAAPHATDEEMQSIIKIAQLEDLISNLPEGLDTIVGERGYRLSGGEKQRVAIARALLCKAPFLLLDEATSSLDSQVERKIQQALEKLVQGRTVIAIAHRLSTIQQADKILVVEKGRIVEQGTHVQLLQKSGLYQKLYESQFTFSVR
jgi:ATP-binding cassette, subfamily B, bacterial